MFRGKHLEECNVEKQKAKGGKGNMRERVKAVNDFSSLDCEFEE